jgi:primosomal protein N'
MVRIVIRDEDQTRLDKRSQELAAWFTQAAAAVDDVTLKGPMPCAISRIAGYYRNQIVLQSPRAGSLQRLLAHVRKQGGLAKSDRIAVDVDPVSLL